MSTQPPPSSKVRQRFKPPAPSTPKKIPASTTKTPRKATFQLDPIFAFYILFGSHVAAALYSPINDCDEVFNYWEPLHYLTHNHGFQTWEYSPDYAIRSWMYIAIHAVLTFPARLLPAFGGSSKTAEFYFLRILLGFVAAVCGTRLHGKVAAVLHPHVATAFVLITALSPGNFHAPIAFLPSSFALYASLLGCAAFMDWRGGLRTAQGIFMFGIGALLGWPFAAALTLPFIVEEFYLGLLNDKDGRVAFFWRITDGITRYLVLMGLQMAVDGFFYKRVAIVSWNIVRYNIFSSKTSAGPEIYGTEPWHFYLRNLALNFHVFLPLALLAIPLLLVQHYFRTPGALKASWLRGVVFTTPLYLWLAIFTLQPHKEERFMYPAYPFLALNAAISVHIIIAFIVDAGKTRSPLSAIPLDIRRAALLSLGAVAIAISAFRIVGTITAFGAPLEVYKILHTLTREGETVCLGKEWYRFPSHFHLPEGVHAKFIKSEFTGLLPGEFSTAEQGFGLFPGAWLVPAGMNDENKEDMGKYIDVKFCDYIVDSQMPTTEATALEPKYINDKENWDRKSCALFLDTAGTGLMGRLGWVPDLPFVPEAWKRSWGRYCLLKRRSKSAGLGQTKVGSGVPVREKMDGMPAIETLL